MSNTRSAYFVRLGEALAATATGAAAGESVNVDEVDAYALIAGQGADHRAESSRGAARASDHFANIVWIHSHLEHPPATEILFLDCDIVGVRDDPPDQMFECLGEHLGLAGIRVSNTCLSSLLGFGWSALDGRRVGLSAFGLGRRLLRRRGRSSLGLFARRR